MSASSVNGSVGDIAWSLGSAAALVVGIIAIGFAAIAPVPVSLKHQAEGRACCVGR